jgi:hypothetical protein
MGSLLVRTLDTHNISPPPHIPWDFRDGNSTTAAEEPIFQGNGVNDTIQTKDLKETTLLHLTWIPFLPLPNPFDRRLPWFVTTLHYYQHLVARARADFALPPLAKVPSPLDNTSTLRRTTHKPGIHSYLCTWPYGSAHALRRDVP